MNELYRLPEGHARVSVEVKKSAFHAFATEVKNKDAATSVLMAEKQRYPAARHHCWAYVIGQPQQPEHASMSDDGEPSGTAGKPILNIIQHHNIGNTMIVVSRYFGGIKLGASGLIRAYAGAAKEALGQLATVPYVHQISITACMSFDKEHAFRHELMLASGTIEHTDYANTITISARVPQANKGALAEKCAILGIRII